MGAASWKTAKMNIPESPLAGEESERLALFISSVTDYAIYMLSVDGHVVSWNAGAQRFKGYSASEIVGQHFSRFYTDEDRARGLPLMALAQAAQSGKFEAEGWRVRKDGSRFWASVVIDAIRDQHGQLLGFAKVTRDITDKREAQEKLRESEQRFRMLVEGVTDYALYMLSPEGVITNWNAGARRIKGFDSEDVVGSNFSRFYTDVDRERGVPQNALASAAREGRFEAEGWRVRKDGSRFWAHVVIDAIRNEQGELMGFAKITRDITERKNAQAELERAREALYQAQKMEAIGKVTGGVAHDFNNLLSVVNNGLILMRRDQKFAGHIKLISTMEQAIQRGATLIQQLLAFARQQPLVRETTDLNRVIASFESVLRRAGNKATNLVFKLAPEPLNVVIDVAQVETGLLNLVVNAHDATPPDGSIVISTHAVALADNEVRKLPAGRYVALTVSDTGHGMPKDTLERAIEPFFTTKAVGKGTGLGLSQVYGMVQQSEGDLKIESTEGAGTAITLYFPASQDEATSTGPSDTDTVLIVDDQADVLDMSAELLCTLGFEVLTANSGEQALEVLQHTPRISLLLSDVVMTGMNGVELATQAVKTFPGLKVILVSGYAGAGFAPPVDGFLEGFHFLSKPYRINDLVRKLRLMG